MNRIGYQNTLRLFKGQVVIVREESSTLFAQFISLPAQREYLDSLGEPHKQTTPAKNHQRSMDPSIIQL
ncbi:MAG TPA: hypothetical protein VEW65_15630 [Chryseolinea sp.]|nr:hypothetical protein [Chryseolinea sp.]